MFRKKYSPSLCQTICPPPTLPWVARKVSHSEQSKRRCPLPATATSKRRFPSLTPALGRERTARANTSAAQPQCELNKACAAAPPPAGAACKCRCPPLTSALGREHAMQANASAARPRRELSKASAAAPPPAGAAAAAAANDVHGCAASDALTLPLPPPCCRRPNNSAATRCHFLFGNGSGGGGQQCLLRSRRSTRARPRWRGL
jgi:hypothetical protein